jgi:hypothetical protein
LLGEAGGKRYVTRRGWMEHMGFKARLEDMIASLARLEGNHRLLIEAVGKR